MSLTTLEANLKEKIKHHLLHSWQTGHGGEADKVHLLLGDEGLALMIPKALYKAEITLTHSTNGSTLILNQYLRTLLDTISMELMEMVEEYTQKSIAEIIPLVDLRAGWMIAFFRFEILDTIKKKENHSDQ